MSSYVNFIRSYWSRRGIPTPSALDVTRFTLPLHLHDQVIYKSYGTIVGLYEGLRPTLMIGDPSLVKDILAKDFINFPNHRAFNFGHTASRLGFFFMKGSEQRWQKLRSMISPSFTTGKMRILTPKINECISHLLSNMTRFAGSRKTIDVVKFYNAFSLDVVAATAFGINLDSFNQPDDPIVMNAKKFFSRKPATRLFFDIYLTFSWIKSLRPSDFESLNFFSKLTEKITREKRTHRKRKYSGGMINGKNLDFIQMFLDIIDFGVDPFPDSIEEEQSDEDETKLRAGLDNVTLYGHEGSQSVPTYNNNRRRKSVSLDELKAQGILFFMAGYAGTATLLSNVSYLLATHPQVQEKLINEIDSWDHSTELNYDMVSTFKYLDAVIWETLRLHPPVARVERESVSDYKLAGTGITVPAGMTVSIPVYAIHRDPKNFEEPDSFIPERFLPNEDGECPLKDSWSFLPFGGGEFLIFQSF